MEDEAPPARPNFGTVLRGFDRTQVIKHIERLEDQVRSLQSELASLEAARQDDASRTDEQHTDRFASSLNHLSGVTGAEEQADAIRERAEADALELISEAEKSARELRDECSKLAAELETRRDHVRHEHAAKINDLRQREQRLRGRIRNEYKRIMASAQSDAEEILDAARLRWQEREAEIDRAGATVEQHRQNALVAMTGALEVIDRHATALRQRTERDSRNGENGKHQDQHTLPGASLDEDSLHGHEPPPN